MRLCFDATRFGFSLKEAVELCVLKQLPAVEYTFEPFAVDGKKSQKISAEEKDYLGQIRAACLANEIEVACINLQSCLDCSDKTAIKHFHRMLGKLAAVAQEVGCQRLSFWIEPGCGEQWMEQLDGILTPVIEVSAQHGVKPVLRLSTPRSHQGQSLRLWRPLQPQEWREILSAFPALSLAFSPADCVWQGIDYLQILPPFTAALELVELHDVEINRSLIADSGLFGPLWWRYRMPGKGQVDWRQTIEALKLYDYQGPLSLCLDDEFVPAQELHQSLDQAVAAFAPYMRG